MAQPTTVTKKSALSSGSSKFMSQGPPRLLLHVLGKTTNVPPSGLRQTILETQTARQELIQNIRNLQFLNLNQFFHNSCHVFKTILIWYLVYSLLNLCFAIGRSDNQTPGRHSRAPNWLALPYHHHTSTQCIIHQHHHILLSS